MPPVKPIYDKNGNRYEKPVHRIKIFVLGERQRDAGETIAGRWHIERTAKQWMYKDACWYINKFILEQCKVFGFDLCVFTGVPPGGKQVTGYFYPEYILLKYKNKKPLTFHGEEQIELHEVDLAVDIAEAKQKLADLKATPDTPPSAPPNKSKGAAQGSLF